MAAPKNERLYDELLCYLGDPVFQIPVRTFMDEHCLSKSLEPIRFTKIISRFHSQHYAFLMLSRLCLCQLCLWPVQCATQCACGCACACCGQEPGGCAVTVRLTVTVSAVGFMALSAVAHWLCCVTQCH